MPKSYSDLKYNVFSTLTEADESSARELHLYADNHADLHRQRTTPVHKNLRNKMASGNYDHEKAKKAFKHVTDDAAKRYKAEHGHHFDVATRRHVAGKMADRFHDEAKAGEHDHHLHKKHKGHKVGESFDSKKSAEEIRLRTKYRMSKDGGKDGKPYSPEDMHGAMDSLQRKKARTSGVKRKGSKHPDNNPVNLKIGEAAGQNPLKTAFGGMKAAKDTPSYKKYIDGVAAAKAKRDEKIKKEREDGTRSRYALSASSPLRKSSKYESVEEVDLEEKLQFKLKTKFKRGTDDRKIYDVVIDGVRVGMLNKETSDHYNYGEGGSYMTFKILQPGSRNKYAETIQVDDVEDPNEFFKKLKANPRTAKRTIKAIKAHGVELTNLDSKHESVEYVDELKKSTIMNYKDKARAQITRDKYGDFGKITTKTNKRLKGVDKATKKLVARQYEEVEQVDELKVKTLRSYISKAQKDNTNRVVQMTDKPNHVPTDKGEMKKLRKRQKGVVKAKTDIDMRKILGKNYRGRMGEDIELDELKMPEKDKRGRAKDPVIGAALERGGRRADLKADGKLRRGDTDGAEGDMKRSRKRQAASRTPVGEAIKFGVSDFKSTGRVTGKGKRDRSKEAEVDVKYTDGVKIPMKAKDMAMHLKSARKGDGKSRVKDVRKEGAYDVATKVTDKFNKVLDKAMKPVEDRAEKKFNSPAKTKLGKLGQTLFNSVEYTDEGMSDSAKRAAKILLSRTPKNVHNPGNPKKPSVGDQEARRREDERLSRREGVEDMTAAQERDADRRFKPTRSTVSKVRLRAGEKDVAKSVKSYQDEKGGNPGNTKKRRLRDLRLRDHVELEEAKSKDIVKGLTDMDGPFTVVAIKNNKVIKQENTKQRNMLPAIVKMMRKEVGVNVTIGIEDRKGTIRGTFKEDVDNEDLKNVRKQTAKNQKARLKQEKDAENFVKKHDCATHVEHAEWGLGNPVKTMHAEPDDNGNIAWYDVMFEHGVEKSVATSDLNILMSEGHHH